MLELPSQFRRFGLVTAQLRIMFHLHPSGFFCKNPMDLQGSHPFKEAPPEYFRSAHPGSAAVAGRYAPARPRDWVPLASSRCICC